MTLCRVGQQRAGWFCDLVERGGMLTDAFPYSANAAPACVLKPKPILVCTLGLKCALARGGRRNAA